MYGLDPSTPPSSHVPIPITLGSSTHSYASVNALQYQRDNAAGSTPSRDDEPFQPFNGVRTRHRQ